jgi:hypothetical protein
MLTIHNLEVHLEVQGDGDEAVFSRYFDMYIRKWSRLMAEAKARERHANENRSLGDQSGQES